MTTRVHEQSILTFDGKDDYINCGNTALGGALAVGNTTLTILGWVNPHRLNPQVSGHGTSNVFFARASKKDNDVLELGISPEGNLEVYIDENKDDITKTFGKGELKSQKWHFFTLVFNKGKITAYLDDKKYTGSFKGTSLNESGGSFVTIGCTLHDDIYFCGQIANISVWQRCCSAAEIKKYRYQPLIGNESGLKAYWLINEGTGRTAQDNSANNFKGSIRGATWSVGEVPFNLPPEELGIIAEQLGATNEQLGGVSDQPAESAEQLSGISQQLGGISQQIGSIPTQPVVSGSQLSGLVQQLSTSAEQLLARAEKPSAIAEQLQLISDQLSANAAESSATTEGLAAIANQLSEISEQLAVNAASSAAMNEQLSGISEQLGATNEQLAGVSDQPAESAEQLSGISQQLGGISQQIGSIPTQPVVSGSQLSGLVQQLSTSAEQLLARAEKPSAIAEQLQSISDQLSANAAESSATTEGLAAIANQLSGISEQLAVNAASSAAMNEQLSGISEQLGATNEQLAGVSDQPAESAEQLSGISQQLGGISQQIGSIPTQPVVSGSQLSGLVQQLSTSAEQLLARAEKPSAIAEQLQSISDQLSANAAESSATTEGLAAIANQLSGISEQLAVNAADSAAINEQLSGISEQLGATNEQLIGVYPQPVASAEQLAGVSQQLGGISQQLAKIREQPVVSGQQLSAIVQQLSVTTEQLLANAEQPSELADQLKEISQQLATTTEQSSATTGELSAIANQLRSISDQLAANAAQSSKISEQSSPILNQEQQTRPMTTESQSTDGKTSKKYRILSIDGGGIRGIIPAMILTEIERRTQKPIYTLFDLIAGTSTGGLISLGLTKPRPLSGLNPENPTAQYTAADLVEMYVEYGGVIFYEPWYEEWLGSLEDILNRPKFSSEGREEVVMKYFGDTPLEDCLKEVLITSYDIEQRIPIFFSSNIEKQWISSRKFRTLCQGFTLKDAAMATSAAPTYFKPYHVPTSHNTNGYYTLVDGGMVANNPANLAMIEAEMTARKKGQTLAINDTILVSLGTGSLTTAYNYHEAKNWGLVQWARPLMNILFDGGSELVAGELRRLLEPLNREDPQLYYRFQTFLTAELEAMDNATGENIRALQGIAKRLIIEETEEIDRLCDLLTSEAT